MPLKPHPTDPDKMVFVSHKYNLPDTPTARAYLAKVLDDDDTQVYGDALTIAYQSGYYDGKKAAQRPWVGLTDEEIGDIFNNTPNPTEKVGPFVIRFSRAIEAKLKEKNNAT